jgi:hypothetical protein
MTAAAASAGGWRTVATVAALVLALLFGVLSQAAHASEVTEHGAHAETLLVKHQDRDGGLLHKIFHVGHCASHCAGHMVAVPPLAGDGEALVVQSTGWGAPEADHLAGLPTGVQDQPPRG